VSGTIEGPFESRLRSFFAMSARVLVVDDSLTIRKVVATILATRDYVPILAEDGEEALELLDVEQIDLVLLDFMMPNMNGYQFCRELRAREEYRNLPVVLMSAKSDKIRGQFVQQTGAVDAISKPFDPRGLIAVVEAALKKREEGRLRPTPDAASMPEDVLESLRPSRNLSDDPGVRKFQAALEFADALERFVGPELERAAANPEMQEMGLALRRGITPDAFGSLSTLMKALDYGGSPREVLGGDISVISIAEVLQMLDLQRQSGALSVFTRKQEITLYIRDGMLDFASGRGLGEEFLIGRHLLEVGALRREELSKVIDQRSDSGRLLGETLAELGLVTEDQVRRALVRQTAELLYEVVRWKSGRFSFVISHDDPIAQKTHLGLETGSLVMEGFRRVDEWRLIEGSFDFDEVLFPDPVALERLGTESNLTPRERMVLEAIDGERSIRAIVGEMGGSSFELCKIVYQFLNSRLVRRKAA
jgi:DNA-binding response OmpR family regulator